MSQLSQSPGCRVRVPIPFPRSARISGKRTAINRGFRVKLIPMEFHDNVFVVDNLTAEEFTYIAIERAYLSTVEFHTRLLSAQ